MRCYFIATNLEQDTSAGYRAVMHRLFIERLPELSHINEQRVSDQRRVIIKNRRLTELEIAQIKEEVRAEVEAQRETIDSSRTSDSDDQEACPNEETQRQVIESPKEAPREGRTGTPLLEKEEEERRAITMNAFNEAFTLYEGTNPNIRPELPKLQYNRFVKKTNQCIDQILKEIIPVKDLETIQLYIYCGAVTALKLNNQNTRRTYAQHKDSSKKGWQQRLENRINNLRRDIGRLTQANQKNPSKRVKELGEKIAKRYPQEKSLTEALDRCKQQLSAYSKRLRRYKKCNRRKEDNKRFQTKQKIFYRSMEDPDKGIEKPPNTENMETFWKGIWSNAAEHEDSILIKPEREANANVVHMNPVNITVTDIESAVKKTTNWKAPGPDKIQNYWLKAFPSTHAMIAEAFNNLIENPNLTPSTLTEGITYMKSKDADTENPAKYRPITCLSTLYKILTAVIASKMNAHLTSNNILTEEQKGCRSGSQGCKEQLIIDSTIMNQARTKQQNLYMAYVDYKKAFDSVPHSWLIEVLKIYKINDKLIKFLAQTMKNWKTRLQINTTQGVFTTEQIHIRRGIFQGDSLSPLWFCLALNPLSKILNNTAYGFILNKKTPQAYCINHLLYMDDIKYYAATELQLRTLLQLTENFSANIKMTFGLDKCRTQRIEKGQHKDLADHILDNRGTIKHMEAGETYKYLGYQQSTKLDHAEIKQTLREKYVGRLKAILKTELSGRNKTSAINAYAVPLLAYSFGVIKWNNTELEEMNRLTRTTCTRFRIHHPTSAVERFTLPRTKGGRGILDIANSHHTQVQTLRQYFQSRKDISRLHSAVIQADVKLTPLNLSDNTYDPRSLMVSDEEKLHKWEQKQIHGKYRHQVKQPYVDEAASHAWLRNGNIYAETEGFMINIQDGTVKTRNYARYILKEVIQTDQCRRCGTATETIDHITGGCTLLAATEYTNRHDMVARIIHQEIAAKYHLVQEKGPYYKYEPEPVLENEEAKLYWNREINSDKTIPHNKPDITLRKKISKETFLIEVSVPNSCNLDKKHFEKVNKYKPLAEEIRQMWKQEKVLILPIILSVTGVIPNKLHDSIRILEINPNIYIEMQKSVIISTCSIVRQFLQCI